MTTSPSSSTDSTTTGTTTGPHRGSAVAVVVTKVIAGGFALGALLATGYGATAVLGSLSTESRPARRVGALDGLGYLVGGPLLAVVVPLLVLCVVTLLCRRPGSVHGWAVAAGAVPLLAVVAVRQVGFGTFLDFPLVLVGLSPTLVWAPALLVLVGGAALVRERTGR